VPPAAIVDGVKVFTTVTGDGATTAAMGAASSEVLLLGSVAVAVMLTPTGTTTGA
jgi:hypothetical protein